MFGGFPPVTNVVKNLIIANALMFLLTYTLRQRGIDLDAYLALHYWQSPLFRWWQPITHLFMHGSIEHILLNMFGLYMFGSILENVWGPKRFLIFYFICGIGAAVFYLGIQTFQFTHFHHAFLLYQEHASYAEYVNFIKHNGLAANPGFSQISAFWHDNPDCTNCTQVSIDTLHSYYLQMINEATVGASGAIFGLLFAFGYLFPNMPVYVMFIPIPVKAKWFVTGYGLIELYSGIQNSPGDNVAHFAHLGGMLFAFILLRIWKTNRNRFY
jgi:membrane associated rhomboid family serine protease